MTDTQLEKYGSETRITSDPFGLFNRDNRNHRKKQDLILDKTHADDGDPVLEVGCGHGLHTPVYAGLYDLYAVDISPSLVTEAKHRAPQATIDRCDAHDLPYKDGAFDAVVGTAILHHMSDQPGAIKEWQRVTKPGGSITLMEPNFLFPKDALTTFTVPEERHKIGMAPWRLYPMLWETCGERFEVSHELFTPPRPERLHSVFDRVDEHMARIPLVRRFSQMLCIHIEC